MNTFKRALTLAFFSLLALVILAGGGPPVARASGVEPNMNAALENAAGVSGSLTGYVKDSATKVGIAGARVVFANNTTALSTTTDATGSYLFPNLPAGAGKVTASAKGYDNQTIDVQIIANQLTQAPDLLLPIALWQKIFGEASLDNALRSIARTNDGGYVVAGDVGINAAENGWIVKMDANGNQEWAQKFSASVFYSVVPASDGGYVAAGYLGGGGSVVKADSNGNELWAKTFTPTGVDMFYSIVRTSDGGYIAAGRTGDGLGFWNGWIVKMDSSANQEWARTYATGVGDDSLKSIVQTSDGGYITSGYSSTSGPAPYDGWVMKLNADGTPAWSKLYGRSSNDSLEGIALASDGGYIGAGLSYSGYAHGWILKLDAAGNQVWSTFIPTDATILRSVVEAQDGGYVATGSYRDVSPNADGYVAKVDADGKQVWDKMFGGTYWDYLYAMAPSGDGGYVSAGMTLSFGEPLYLYDGWVIKMDANGNTGPNPRYTESNRSTPPAVPFRPPVEPPFGRP